MIAYSISPFVLYFHILVYNREIMQQYYRSKLYSCHNSRSKFRIIPLQFHLLKQIPFSSWQFHCKNVFSWEKFLQFQG
uniref:Ovule protein n=1 Tax=Parascaris univalens TaxID=6257 RepID=A0A915AST0_PARUN